ncbi:VapE domain-containing protein [Pleomorphomonas oryzae]|uniref:VapE domain-containing protein n=1 Tax=Pleomorphomonas oryzae TaxID=261934 RepID=UPI00040395A0|nr:VapE domain-containing protein [Pleomorphomonas oryzae]
MFDVERMRREANLARIAASFGVKLTKDGEEHVGCCPFHREDTPSFSIFTGKDSVQRFHCFGCGEHGDAIEFTQKIKGVDFKEACRILGGKRTDKANIAPRTDVAPVDAYAGITIEPPPADLLHVGQAVKLYNPKRAKTDMVWGQFVTTHVHPYRDQNGDLLGYVLRRNLRDGGKETPMVMWVRLPGGGLTWSRFPFPTPRPIYGREHIGNARQVIVVEGEKCVDKGRKATGRVFVSWAGGTQGAKYADWSALAGLDIVIWPDADGPGLDTVNGVPEKPGKPAKKGIAENLVSLGCRVRIIATPAFAEDGDKRASFEDVQAGAAVETGWDCADAIDAGWTGEQLDEFIKTRLREWTPPDDPQPTGGLPAPEVQTQPAEVESQPAPQPEPEESNVIALRPKQQAKLDAKEKKERKPPAGVPADLIDIRTRVKFTPDTDWKRGLIEAEEGLKASSPSNWQLFLEHSESMKGVFQYNEFTNTPMLINCPPWERESGWKPRPLKDTDYAEALMWLERIRMAPKHSALAPMVMLCCSHNSFDPLRDYVESLEWDGQPRVDTWLTYYAGVPDSPYTRAVGKKYLISAIARALSPGCKVDTMLILEGPQGRKKSTLLRRIFGDEFFTDKLSDIGSKDASQEMAGVWCIEVAEMHRFSAADFNQVKKFLSTQEERYRPPYGRSVIRAPRRVVLAGTINPDGQPYFNDPTGARRFWPVTVGERIAIDDIAADRDQIWAEAVHLFRQGEAWWIAEGEHDVVAEAQESRTDLDAWTGIIVRASKDRATFSQLEICDLLSIRTQDLDRRHTSRVARIMNKLGWDRRISDDEVVYKKPGASPTRLDEIGDWDGQGKAGH